MSSSAALERSIGLEVDGPAPDPFDEVAEGLTAGRGRGRGRGLSVGISKIWQEATFVEFPRVTYVHVSVT